MKRVLFFTHSLSNGVGIERMTTSLANALEDEGLVIRIVVLSSVIDSFYRLNKEIEVVSLRVNKFLSLQSIVNLRKMIKEWKPDYIINSGVQMSMTSILSSIGFSCKVITWEHFFLKAGSKCGYLMRIFSVIFGFKQVVLTETDLLDYPKLFRKKIIPISNFSVIDGHKISDLTHRIVLAVGRLDYIKGFDRLLKVWALCLQKKPDWMLYIVGSGVEECALKKLSVELGITDYVLFVPNTRDISTYYSQSSIYAMSSRYEGLSMVLIEAKSFGLPCVAFDCPNGPRSIIRDEVDGLLVKDGDEDAYYQALVGLMDNLDKRNLYSNNAYKDFEERFTKKSIVDKWMSILK